MILIAGQLENLTTRKDRTIKLSLGTNELTPNECADLFKLNQQFCYVAIKAEPFISNELEALESLKTDLDTQKTPSQRLRSILYVYYEQNNKGYKDFNTYYFAEMEKICEHYKTKLI